MNKYEVDSNVEILDNIKKIILNRHPIVDDRLDFLMSNSNMEINIKFYNQPNVITDILFLDGTDNYKSSIQERIKINNLININTINEVIRFLISDHDIIRSINKSETEIKLQFVVNLCDDNLKGISCSTIELSLDFYGYDNYEEIINMYFKSIIKEFFNQLTHTEWYKEEYKKYFIKTKAQIINSLNEEDLQTIFGLLTNEDKCNILFNIPDDRFGEIYSELQIMRDKVKIKTMDY